MAVHHPLQRIKRCPTPRAKTLMLPYGNILNFFQEDAEWCESNTTAKWAEDVLGVLTTVSPPLAPITRTRTLTLDVGA